MCLKHAVLLAHRVVTAYLLFHLKAKGEGSPYPLEGRQSLQAVSGQQPPHQQESTPGWPADGVTTYICIFPISLILNSRDATWNRAFWHFLQMWLLVLL